MSEAAPGRGGIRRALAYWGSVGLTVAGLTHLVAVLALPYRSADDAAARLARMAGRADMATIAGPLPLPDQDPALAAAFCRYDLRRGPVQVGLDVTGDAVAMLSVYGRHGRVLYGLTGRSAAQNHLDLAILTPGQAAARLRSEGSALAKVRIEADEPEGVVIAQVLAAAPSAMRQAAAAAARLACRPEGAEPPKAGVALR